jgi:hypothetical protein
MFQNVFVFGEGMIPDAFPFGWICESQRLSESVVNCVIQRETPFVSVIRNSEISMDDLSSGLR